ncbi:uncharacterized protein L3040_006339 [Drepanopeziza brunnea f. sp. 'multigermtubi']|uniref:uncharacterized protein n=1 Tax=Drepanopeziza brunnea f. sp. 'multigermtubi' TaxID=698441 RepID=UPI0023A286CA|nr:hypothetical protein L3040_006339 [Drepanopeziza brunnea f. sp. 'multigermtubi']
MKPPTLLCAIRAFSRLPRSKPLCTHLTAVRFVQTPSPSPPPRHFSTTPLRPSTYTPSPSSSPSPSPSPSPSSSAKPRKLHAPPPPTSPTAAALPRPPKPEYEITFTCTPCGARSTHLISKQGYHRGSVLVTCPGCRNRHVVADHLNIFGDKHMTIEDLMREQGQLVKKGTLSDDGDLEFWADGTTTARGSGSGTGGEEGEKRD